MKVSEIPAGAESVVVSVYGNDPSASRLRALGFVAGNKVMRKSGSLFGGMSVYRVDGTEIALRKSDSDRIQVRFPADGACEDCRQVHGEEVPDVAGAAEKYVAGSMHKPVSAACGECSGCSCCKVSYDGTGDAVHDLAVALVGTPNCGKTTLFNSVSGRREKTGNYCGMTVRRTEGTVKHDGLVMKIVDLPGTYSLEPYSPEEAYVRDELRSGKFGIVLNVLDAGNLMQGLKLTFSLAASGLRVVCALNMFDEFRESGSFLDVEELERRTGIPMIPVSALKKEGLEDVLDAVALSARASCSQADDHEGSGSASCTCGLKDVSVSDVLDGIYSRKVSRKDRTTCFLDRIFLNRYLSFPLLAAIMAAVFWITFSLGAYPMEWIDSAVSYIAVSVRRLLPAGIFSDMLADGVVSGVGSVLVFLPNIVILYLLIYMLEGSGYLARAAVIADPLLSRTGMHGKSFVPMLMGFGCNVPAITAARTIENPKVRLMTVLSLPFVSCSARLPVYMVFTAAFFPDHAAVVIMCLYFLGMAASLGSASLMHRLSGGKGCDSFMMEMPVYRFPSLPDIFRKAVSDSARYLRKMGGIILIASMVIWFLGYVPEERKAEGGDSSVSAMERMGHFIEPAIEPLGFDWKMGVGILSGFGAKELMVSSLGVLYGLEDGHDGRDGQVSIVQALRTSVSPASGLSYMVFALLYFPCVATLAAIAVEAGGKKWAFFAALYTTLVAYVSAFLVYRVALFAGM